METQMELQKLNGQQELTVKEKTARFVHDVADMEIRLHTLVEVKRACYKEKDKLEREISSISEEIKKTEDKEKSWKLDLEIAKKAVDEMEKKCRGSFFKHLLALIFSPYFLLKLILCAMMSLIPGAFTLLFLDVGAFEDGVFNRFDLFLILKAFGSWALLIYIIWAVGAAITFRKDLKEKRQYYSEKQQHPKEHLKTIDSLKQKKRELNNAYSALSERIFEVDQACDIVVEKLELCYELGIIKPAYSNAVCVIVLDEIFTNDKADTMREAMLLCDAELRHHELVGKLDEVVHALKKIGSSLSHMNYVLNSINENVSMISQDIYNMTESQEKIAYAAESVQKSAENADMYIYQRRTGMI